MTSHDIILPPHAASAGISRSKAAAFVPLAIALFGVAAILFGGISARTNGTDTASLRQVDPMTTGSIATPADERRALQMLDR